MCIIYHRMHGQIRADSGLNGAVAFGVDAHLPRSLRGRGRQQLWTGTKPAKASRNGRWRRCPRVDPHQLFAGKRLAMRLQAGFGGDEITSRLPLARIAL
jgi:hypothetical protein